MFKFVDCEIINPWYEEYKKNLMNKFCAGFFQSTSARQDSVYYRGKQLFDTPEQGDNYGNTDYTEKDFFSNFISKIFNFLFQGYKFKNYVNECRKRIKRDYFYKYNDLYLVSDLADKN
jgi:hypothetical protein